MSAVQEGGEIKKDASAEIIKDNSEEEMIVVVMDSIIWRATAP